MKIFLRRPQRGLFLQKIPLKYSLQSALKIFHPYSCFLHHLRRLTSKTLRKTAIGMEKFLRQPQGGDFPLKNSSQKFLAVGVEKFSSLYIAVFFSVLDVYRLKR